MGKRGDAKVLEIDSEHYCFIQVYPRSISISPIQIVKGSTKQINVISFRLHNYIKPL